MAIGAIVKTAGSELCMEKPSMRALGSLAILKIGICMELIG